MTAYLLHAVVMLLLGMVAAAIGSLAGLGGGFLVAPALRLIFHLSPSQAAGTSLVLVLANVASASVAFYRQGRVDVRLGVTMGLLAIPGSIGGALLVKLAPGAWFDLLYAGALVIFAIDLWRRPSVHAEGGTSRLPWARARTFRDGTTGVEYRYTESPPIAAAAGVATGFLSSFFGIGGGVLVVPVMLRLFAMPAHVVSATSHTVILFSAPFGVATQALTGDIDWSDAIPLALGGLAGGQIGAQVSRYLSGPRLVRILAIVLTVAAASLISQHVAELPPFSGRHSP
jgi:uncharacterized membrane protein YfcA